MSCKIPNKNLALFLVTLSFILVLVSGVIAVDPSTDYFVATTGNDANDCLSSGTACLTIQAAITKASIGDTINVAAGTTYAESLTINKALILQGAGRDVTTVTGTHTITANDVVIDGFKLQGTGSTVVTIDDTTAISGGAISNNKLLGGYDGIRVGGSGASHGGVRNVEIKDNIITGNTKKGIRFYAGPDYTVQVIGNITVSGNEITSNGDSGISTYGDGHNTIINNIITSNTGNGISVKYDDGDVISGNTVTGNAAMGINMHQVTNSLVENNTVSDHVSTGVVTTFWGGSVTAGKGSAIYIHENSYDNTIRLNTLVDNKIGVLVNREVAGTDPSSNSINDNKITGNTVYGIQNALVDPSTSVDATENYWGESNPDFNTIVLGNVTYDPWWMNEAMTLPSTFITLFNDIYDTLESSGIENNIDTCGTTPDSCAGLYFMKVVDGTELGKLSFSTALNLTDSETTDFLQNLGNKLEQGNGRISLDTTESAIFTATGATLEMYDLPFVEESNLVVRDNDGNVLNHTDLISGFAYDSGTVSFNAAHFTQFDIDTTPPIASITSPLGGIIFGTTTIDATASDSLGIAKVEFWYASIGEKIGEGTETSPGIYSIEWDTTSTGLDADHSIWVEAYDNAGNQVTSDLVLVTVDNCADNDGDGYGDPASASCTYSELDCNEGDPSTYQNIEGYSDNDGDGYTIGASQQVCSGESLPPEYVELSLGEDCNEGDGAVNPGATEVCDGIDNDCDGSVDESDAIDASNWYVDADLDTFGDPNYGGYGCVVPSGAVLDNTDCNDADANIYQILTGYKDNDVDTFTVGDSQQICSGELLPPGYIDTQNSEDCDDADVNINPDAVETCDGIDNNCNGQIDENLIQLADNLNGACSENTQTCSEGQWYDSENNYIPAEETCNTVDDNCDSQVDEGVTTTFFQDFDSDLFGNSDLTTQACSAPEGYVDNNLDCNDENGDIYQLLAGYQDNDADAFTVGDSQQVCSGEFLPPGYVDSSNPNDCDDVDGAINPGATEVWNNEVDEDCDGVASVDTEVPTVDTVDSDNQTYVDEDSIIKVTFSEDIANTPSIEGNYGGSQTVTDCDDGDAKTFCFTVPRLDLTNETITISEAQDAATNTMVEDSTHTFIVNNIDENNIDCGDTINENLTLIDSLDCSGSDSNGLIIGADNITLDCNSSSILSEDYSYYGIYIESLSGITLKNCTISGFENGIYVYNSEGITIEDNTITDNDGSGIYIDAELEESSNHIITGNTINENAQDCSSGCGGIELRYEDNNLIQDNEVSNNGYNGVSLYESYDNQILNNTINGNSHFGIKLSSSSDGNNVSGNTLTDNSNVGIRVSSSQENRFTDNIIEGDGTFEGWDWGSNYGVYLDNYNDDVEQNAFESNNISGYYYGFYAYNYEEYEYNINDLTLKDENIHDNIYGIYLSYVGDSEIMPTISNSEIYNNTHGVYLQSSYANITDTNFNDNSDSEGDTTGLYVDSSSTAYVTNGDFVNNGEWGIYDPLRDYVYWTINGNAKCINNNITIQTYDDNEEIYKGLTFEGGVLELENCTIFMDGNPGITLTGNITSLEQIQQSIDENISTEIDASDADTNIIFYLNGSVISVITVASANESSSGATAGLLYLKGINVEIDSDTDGALTWAFIKIFYDQSELDALGIDETTLKIYYYNETLGDWQLEPNQGVDTVNDYVWANVTHFSVFGAFGSAPAPAAAGGGGGGGGSTGLFKAAETTTPTVPTTPTGTTTGEGTAPATTRPGILGAVIGGGTISKIIFWVIAAALVLWIIIFITRKGKKRKAKTEVKASGNVEVVKKKK